MTMDINIIEDAVPSNLYSEIKQFLQNSNVGWHFIDNITQQSQSISKEQFTLNSYGFSIIPYAAVLDNYGRIVVNENATVNPELFSMFYPMYLCQLDKLQLKASDHELLRIYVGLLTNQGMKVIHDPHTDVPLKHRVMLTYFTTEEGSGETLFYKDNLETYLSNYPKENTMVEFDGSILHGSTSPMKNSVRYAVNINYRKKGE